MDCYELAPVRVFRNGISSYFCLNLLPYLLSSQYYHIVFSLKCSLYNLFVDKMFCWYNRRVLGPWVNSSSEKLSLTLNILEKNYDWLYKQVGWKSLSFLLRKGYCHSFNLTSLNYLYPRTFCIGLVETCLMVQVKKIEIYM